MEWITNTYCDDWHSDWLAMDDLRSIQALHGMFDKLGV